MIATVTSILAIDIPEKLFSAPDAVADEYKIFAKKFHPDINPHLAGATEAFVQLNMLHEKAKDKIKLGEWVIPGQLDFIATDGKKFRIHFVKDFDAGICKAYIGKAIVTYVFTKDVKDLVTNATSIIGKFKFPAEVAIKKSIEPALPKIKKIFETADKIVLIIEKPETMIRLRDVFEHLNGKFNPKHAAWIMSRCYNFICYLEWLGFGHHEISMDSIFIDPESHTMSLLGGWWYASPIGERMKRLQASRTIKYAPRAVLTSKTTNVSTDLELIRLLGRELLGDPSGIFLSKNADIPANFVMWLRMINSGKARTDYTKWDETLVKAFGPKKFTKFELKYENVYH